MPKTKASVEQGKPEESQNIFKARILAHEMRRADSFLANPNNWRTHPLDQREMVSESLRRIGWVEEVMVNRRSSDLWPEDLRNVETMVNGHLRVSLALVEGPGTLVPTAVVDLTPDEERILLATLDPLAALAGRDDDVLQQLLSDIVADDAGLDMLLGSVTGADGDATAPPTAANVSTEHLAPRKMMRVLISVPVDKAMHIGPLMEQLEQMDGVEIDYGAN